MALKLTKRELATVLAALRYWQRSLAQSDEPPICEHFDEHITPLPVDQIDTLIERLNCR
jgi:hypothetical protein